MNHDVKTICRHFGICGGCRFQDLDYSLQLRKKEGQCRELLRDSKIKADLKTIIPAPRLSYYRNKMEFTFSQDREELVCGLYRRDSKRGVFQLRECRIFSEDAPLIMEAITEFARKSALLAYHPYRHRGFWRNLIIREGKFTDQIMVNLVTTSQEEIDEDSLAELIGGLPTRKKIVSLIRTINNSHSNAVIPEHFSVIRGEAFLEERIDGINFRIFPFSFFQVNPSILSTFYYELKGILDPAGNEKILDVFCGIGMIGLVLSRRAASITGIELDEATVENARINAGMNRVHNLEFLPGKAASVLLEHRHNWHQRFHLAILNPPRSGISKKVIKRIIEIDPERIIYSSCNPGTFFTQARMLLDNYRLVSVQPFDFFPHTPHMELLALFEQR
ncbi:MAG: 23S rRNA (uracil(1939)-C(5))-methyltransferase RlmD [Candidatus Euphemobacter frigidus]|nr:23S rRNA (uracil(1939)-C(5))-methyltransferase RlmD [Candidatus Euphemobacter frigidus]MDP8275888.1 23S rRNA (uracil(1939)-C(5))-methyltransferase RlmD [Candidatus Euphemobacter frigidus]